MVDEGVAVDRERIALRTRLLEVDPSGVRDEHEATGRDEHEAMGRCERRCHPRPGRDLHFGRARPYPLTADERQERADEVTTAFEVALDAYAPVREANARPLPDAAAGLAVRAHDGSPGAPWVIARTLDGLTFVMHEPGDADDVIADDTTGAIRMVTARVRSAPRRSRCPHATTAEARLSPGCGQPLVDPALPDDPGLR